MSSTGRLAASLSALLTAFSLLALVSHEDPWLRQVLVGESDVLLGAAWVLALLAVAAALLAPAKAALANLIFILTVITSLNWKLVGSALEEPTAILTKLYTVYSALVSESIQAFAPLKLLVAGMTAATAVRVAVAAAAGRRAAPAVATQAPSQPPRPASRPVGTPSGAAPGAMAAAQAPAKPKPVQAKARPRPTTRPACPPLSEWGRILAEGGADKLASCWIGREVYSYVIDELLGAGGFGMVFKAHSKYDPSEIAAVKIVYPVTVPLEARERDKMISTRKITEIAEDIHRESSSLRELSEKSPFIVRLHAIHIDTNLLRQALTSNNPEIYIENPLAIIMEYMGGGDLNTLLQNVIRKHGSASLKSSDEWVLASSLIIYVVAEALETVHSSGYMHSDVKPQNILFTAPPPLDPSDLYADLLDSVRGVAAGQPPKVLPKLSDLGSAVRIGEAVTGFTPLYAAPELLLYDNLCSGPEAAANPMCLNPPKAAPELDIYSLGLIALQLYGALTGKELASWRSAGQLDTPEGVASALRALGVPRDIAPMLERMLHPEPSMRPKTGEVARFFREKAGL